MNRAMSANTRSMSAVIAKSSEAFIATTSEHQFVPDQPLGATPSSR
jgi:hypothetical protein